MSHESWTALQKRNPWEERYAKVKAAGYRRGKNTASPQDERIRLTQKMRIHLPKMRNPRCSDGTVTNPKPVVNNSPAIVWRFACLVCLPVWRFADSKQVQSEDASARSATHDPDLAKTIIHLGRKTTKYQGKCV